MGSMEQGKRQRTLLSPSDRRVAAALKRALVKANVTLDSVIVYGSRARGDSHADSDLDVLIVVDRINTHTRERIFHCAWSVGFEAGILIQPVVKERKRIEKGIERDSLLMLAVRAEGIPV
jgi:uncharacterized protein